MLIVLILGEHKMPYIKMVDREKFKVSILEALGVMNDSNDNFYLRGEYFGFFVNRLCRRFLNAPDYTANSFNSAFFNESKKKTLVNASDSISAALNRADPLTSAGEMNYAITAVLWGVLGDAVGFEIAGYGIRAYLTGILEKVCSSIDTVNVGSQKDMTMTFRRHLIIRGVLHDVLLEVYRRKTALYENNKLDENGDIWDGKGRLV